MNNNVNREVLKKDPWPRSTLTDVDGFDDIYAAPHFDRSKVKVGEGYAFNVPSSAKASKRYARPIPSVRSLPFIPNRKNGDDYSEVTLKLPS